MKNRTSRREFILNAASGTALLMGGGILPGFSAKSYHSIIGANSKLRVSVMGVNSRSYALAQNFDRQDEWEVIHICDVDSRVTGKCVVAVQKIQEKAPQVFSDFRKSLESKDVDILVVAAPD
jgi:hypothetical protein